MNLNMVRPKDEREDLLISITKNGQTLIEQTHTKAQEKLNLKLSLEVYNFIFNITEENNKFELYTHNFGEFQVTALKDEPEEILSILDFTPSHL